MAVMAVFIYIQKVNSQREISGLQSDAEELKATVTELQERINGISNIANSENTKSDDKVERNQNNNKTKQYKIEGKYICDDKNQYEEMTYTFSNGRVKFEMLGSNEGTYVVQDNIITITYDDQHIDPDGTVVNGYLHEKTEKLTIKDESTLVTADGTRYVK